MLSIRVDVEAALAGLKEIRASQIPFATSVAINRTANQVKKRLVEEMARVFDRPTSFTLDSIYVVPSTKQKLVAIVGIKDTAAKGTPASKYLFAEVEGGIRRPKRGEKALSFKGILPPGMYAVPGSGLKLDAFGNIPKGTMTAILDALKSNVLDPSQHSPRVLRRGRPRMYAGTLFVAPVGGRLAPGVYMRVGLRGIIPLLMFVRAPVYAKRFKFYDVAAREIQDVFKGIFATEMANAIRTAH